MTNPVHFFGIGAQKAGTTWLNDVLDGYRDCAVPPLKELHYFDIRHLEGDQKPVWLYQERVRLLVQLTNGFARDLETYYACFGGSVLRDKEAREQAKAKAKAAAGSPDWASKGPPRTFQDGYLSKVNVEKRLANIEQLARYLRIRDTTDYAAYLDEIRQHKGASTVGEFSPSYAMLPAAAYQEMDARFPDCRFIFIMRDPLDRFLSQLRFRKKVLALNGVREFDPVAHFDDALADPLFLQRSDYRYTIETLESVIPRDRILYLFFEEMVAPETLVANLRKVEHMLQLSARPEDELLALATQKKNVSESASFSAGQVQRATTALAPVYSFVNQRFGGMPAAWTPPSGAPR